MTPKSASTPSEKLSPVNPDRERQVEELTERLDAALEELEAFSFSISHDLRAPLRGITGFAQALQEGYGSKLDAEGLRLLAVIRAEARSMGQLIDDLLAFSRIGRQPVELSTIDMTELAEGTFQNLAESTPGASPEFVLEPLPPARGDRAMLRQVFANLLGNAIKFSSHQAQPRVELAGWSEAGGNTYTVKDNGVGFEPRDAAKLFGIFQRLHGQHEFTGTGMGLAVVRRVIQRHGGKVWADGKVGAGATFYFTLPGSQLP